MPTSLAMCRCVLLQLALIIFSTAWTFSLVKAKDGSSSLGRVQRDCRPRLNYTVHFLMVLYEGEELPYTLTRASLILVRFFPFLSKNIVTVPYSTFSIVRRRTSLQHNKRTRNTHHLSDGDKNPRFYHLDMPQCNGKRENQYHVYKWVRPRIL